MPRPLMQSHLSCPRDGNTISQEPEAKCSEGESGALKVYRQPGAAASQPGAPGRKAPRPGIWQKRGPALGCRVSEFCAQEVNRAGLRCPRQKRKAKKRKTDAMGCPSRPSAAPRPWRDPGHVCGHRVQPTGTGDSDRRCRPRGGTGHGPLRCAPQTDTQLPPGLTSNPLCPRAVCSQLRGHFLRTGLDVIFFLHFCALGARAPWNGDFTVFAKLGKFSHIIFSESAAPPLSLRRGCRADGEGSAPSLPNTSPLWVSLTWHKFLPRWVQAR